MSEPGHQVAAAWASRGRLRTSHADRERMVDVLKAAFVQGRLTKEEFDVRVGLVFGSRTHAELATVVADLPVGLIETQTPRQAARPRPPMAPKPPNHAVTFSMAGAYFALTLLALGLFDPGYVPFVATVMFWIMFAAGAQVVYARHEKRSRRPLAR
jgi:hypothetical protein